MPGKKAAGDKDPALIQALNLVDRYLDDPAADPFWGPVLWKEWGLDDYPEIVKEPMDLSTVKSSLQAGKYSSNMQEFARDMRLIWSNCMVYNQEKSDFYKRAKRFERIFEKDLNKILNPKGNAKGSKAAKSTIVAANKSDKSRGPSLEDKASFCIIVRQISEVGLGKLVQSLDELCENALIKHSPSEVEINIDAIDLANFRKHEELIKKLLQDEQNAQGGGDENIVNGNGKRPAAEIANSPATTTENGRNTKKGRIEQQPAAEPAVVA